MPITFRSDLISGSRIMLGENGYTKTERIKVLGLPLTPASNIGWRAIQALQQRYPDFTVGATARPGSSDYETAHRLCFHRYFCAERDSHLGSHGVLPGIENLFEIDVPVRTQ